VIEILEYTDAAGISRFGRWRDSLDASVRARITVALDKLSRGNFGVAKSVGGGVSELKLDLGPGYRIYFGRHGDRLVILLAGGTKQRQQVDIEIAQTCWQAYKREKSEKA
jgi:putative addiction module killer protein